VQTGFLELNMKVLDGALGIHDQALSVRSRRLEVLSQNIANADTPGFKARDVDFRHVLADVARSDSAMRTTQDAHFKIGEHINPDGTRYRTPFNTSFDGNTVEMSVEQAHYGKAAAEYQATLNFLENRIGGIRKALRGE
jgi:flagellar basal-body rod protein FlgB